jgi:hypothetical protein
MGQKAHLALVSAANCNLILTFLSCPRNTIRVTLLDSDGFRRSSGIFQPEVECGRDRAVGKFSRGAVSMGFAAVPGGVFAAGQRRLGAFPHFDENHFQIN